ncbi:MAG: RDD family protein [Acholeplasmatales bacterium]|nr:RDD family protein [Acholeplasmatales bacterium]
MVSYKNATNGQRFLAYIIDMILIGAVAGFITFIIFTIIGHTDDLMNIISEFMKEAMEYSDAYLEATTLEQQQALDEQFVETYLEFFKELMRCVMVEALVEIPTYLALYVGYFMVMPKLVSWQTIGRLAAKCKVVADDNSDVEWKHLILREGVGAFLLCYLLGGGLLQLVSGIVALAKGRSMIDYIGGTNLVSTKDVEYIQEEVSQEESEYRVY